MLSVNREVCFFLIYFYCINAWAGPCSTVLFIYYYYLFYLFIFWLCWVLVAVCRLSLVAASGDYSSLRCAGFSLWWPLLLRSTGSRRAGFSSCGSQALERRLSSCGARALLLRGTWDLPGPGLEPVSPALAGGFLTTAPPGKPQFCLFLFLFFKLFLAALGLRCCVRAFSLQQVGATLRCGAWASHCGGFSCCGAWALGAQASVVVAHGLSSCGVWAQ